MGGLGGTAGQTVGLLSRFVAAAALGLCSDMHDIMMKWGAEGVDWAG